MLRPLLCAALSLAIAAGQSREDLRPFRDGIARAVANLDAALRKPGAQPSVRDLPNAALAKLILGQPAPEAEALLRFAFEQQAMDAQQPGYGTVPWQIGRPEVKDANAIEFTMQPVGPILIGYGNALSQPFRDWLRPHVAAAFAAMRNHKVPVSYTNIFLMKTVNLMLAGEAVGDAEAASQGYAQLDEWTDYTKRAGIHEFNSPTYYCTDLNSLVAAYRYAGRPEVREKIRRILDYFWTDIAANYFAGRARMSGPHSRDYDFLTGHGGIEFYLAAAGWREKPYTDRPDLEKVYLLVNDWPGGYQPPESIRRIAAIPNRTVIQTWGLEPDNVRTHYITADYSIGSTSSNYNAQDKLVSVELASRDDIPAITVVPDPFDAPWGKARMKDRSGHSKPWHAPLNLTSVQAGSTVLALLDIDQAASRTETTFATNVILPAAARTITLDGKPVTLAAPATYPAAENSVVALRLGNGAVAVRVFRATAFGPGKPPIMLQTDSEGLKYGAARLTVYHFNGGKLPREGRALVGILISCARATSDRELEALTGTLRDAVIEDRSDGKTWTVTAHAGGVHLKAGRSFQPRRTLFRRVNGGDARTGRLSIDGREYSPLNGGL